MEYEEHLNSPIKKGRKKRIKKRRTMSSSTDGCMPDCSDNTEAKTPEATEDSAKIPEDPETETIQPPIKTTLTIDLGKEKKEKSKRRSEETNPNHVTKKFKNFMDKIVSPVVPQPGAWLKRSNSIKLPRPRQRQNKGNDETVPTFKDENKRFQYGNYNRYYGYRNACNETDHRLKVFSYYPYLFENKDILDIGCNIGHITLSIARDFKARSITGIDIDSKLISIARKNVKHYVKTAESASPRIEINSKSHKSSSEFFPLSLPILYGPIDIPGFHDTHLGREFPNNVIFKQCNYVLEDESLLALEQPQFDVIICLSVTKWIHLNWGDNGLKIAFRRMYEQLRPGGKLILEPQHWASYKSKKKLTEIIYRNYKAIDFFPDKFRDYLLSPAVGFAKSEILGFPQHKSSGFRRPIQVFTKSTMFPSERIEATPSSNATQTVSDKEESQTECQNREHVYTNFIQTTPKYNNCSEEHVDSDVLSPADGKVINNRTFDDIVSNYLSKCCCDNATNEHKNSDLTCENNDIETQSQDPKAHNSVDIIHISS
ncbi:hypothetical protein ABEB36_008721 [Hypothenemus hampei]